MFLLDGRSLLGCAALSNIYLNYFFLILLKVQSGRKLWSAAFLITGVGLSLLRCWRFYVACFDFAESIFATVYLSLSKLTALLVAFCSCDCCIGVSP